MNDDRLASVRQMIPAMQFAFNKSRPSKRSEEIELAAA
jgi:hypothetical protein